MVIITEDGQKIRADNIKLYQKGKNCLGEPIRWYKFYNVKLKKNDKIRFIDVKDINITEE